MIVEQKTLRRLVSFHGIGVHNGSRSNIKLVPAEANTGIMFSVLGLAQQTLIPANTDNILRDRTLQTVLKGSTDSISVATIEHVLAALRITGVDNVLIEIEGVEVPILDGSICPFVQGILESGLEDQGSPRTYIKIIRKVITENGAGSITFLPSDGQHFKVSIDFPEPIGRQSESANLSAEAIPDELLRARTFGFITDAKRYWAAGLALGANLENTLTFDGKRVMNPEGLRSEHEPAWHKLVDLIGDSALTSPLLGTCISNRGGHALNQQAFRRLLNSPKCWYWSYSDGSPISNKPIVILPPDLAAN